MTAGRVPDWRRAQMRWGIHLDPKPKMTVTSGELKVQYHPSLKIASPGGHLKQLEM